MQFLWLKIDDIAGKGLEWHVVAELLLYFSASLVPRALPLAVLLSSIMTFGNLGEYFELTAIKSSGIPLQKFMRPLTLFTALLTIGAFFYSNHVIPYANLKAYALLHDIKKQREELKIREGIFYNDIDEYTIKVDKKNEETKLMKGIMIYKNSTDGNVQTTVADSGYIRMADDATKLLITLYSGQTYKEIENNDRRRRNRDAKNEYPFQIHRFQEQNMLLDIKGFNFTRTDESMFQDSYQMLNVYELEKNIDSLKQNYSKRAFKFSKSVKRNTFSEEKLLQRVQERHKDKGNSKPTPPKHQEKIQKSAETKQNKANTRSTNNKNKIDSKNKSKDQNLAGENQNSQLKNPDMPAFNIQKYLKTLSARDKRDVVDYAITMARKNSKKISRKTNHFQNYRKRIYKNQIEYHKKFTLSVACIIFFFIGAPLGSIIRKGGLGTPLIISVIMFIIYYIISITGENFAEEGSIPAYIGMWISTAVFLPIGIFLTYKATNDSVILNSDTYIKTIKKIFQFKFKKISSQEEAEEENQ
jgi:lipopolysaccharide export system permease protein